MGSPRSRTVRPSILFAVFIIVIALGVYRQHVLAPHKPYQIIDGQTAFLCETIGNEDWTNDAIINYIQRADLDKEYANWKQKNENRPRGTCQNIDQIIIE